MMMMMFVVDIVLIRSRLSDVGVALHLSNRVFCQIKLNCTIHLFFFIELSGMTHSLLLQISSLSSTTHSPSPSPPVSSSLSRMCKHLLTLQPLQWYINPSFFFFSSFSFTKSSFLCRFSLPSVLLLRLCHSISTPLPPFSRQPTRIKNDFF